MSTANHKYLATIFFSDKTIEKYTSKYFDVIEDLPEQDKSSVIVEKVNGKITIEDVHIGLAKGKLIRIPDPAKVDVGICDYIGNIGLTLDILIGQERAKGGINAGGYAKKQGSAHGSIPGGIIVKDGKLIYMEEDYDEEFCVIGFDKENLLVTAYAETEEDIENMNLRCAVSFGPPLIINGEGLITQSGTSLQPRTAIAQCGDGSVLFLVLDGRQPSSAGATLMQVQELLLEKGAVTAANLDGGSSSAMIYERELLTSPSDDGELKRLPTAFVIGE